jgi:hypothetical protein
MSPLRACALSIGRRLCVDQRVGMSETTTAPLGLAVGGRAVVLSLCLACGPSSSQTADWSGRGAHVAAAGIAAAPGSDGRASEKRDLKWLLVQSPPFAGVAEELILVEVPEFLPESVDDRIAREYGLQLVTRLTFGGPGRRIVVYRAFDGRSPTEVVATLRRDRRVSSAQMNIVYGLPPAAPAQGAISDAKSPILGKQAKRQGSPYDQKGGPTSGPRPTVGEPVRALPSSGATQVLVTRKHGLLRWPTADEPFLDLGMTDK